MSGREGERLLAGRSPGAGARKRLLALVLLALTALVLIAFAGLGALGGAPRSEQIQQLPDGSVVGLAAEPDVCHSQEPHRGVPGTGEIGHRRLVSGGFIDDLVAVRR